MEQSKVSKEKFQDMVKEVSPNTRSLANCARAFVFGGLICVIGQFINDMILNTGVPKDTASMYTSVILIFIGVFLTGIGVYDKLGKYAGAGSVVPITGFANSVAAPAIEFKKEGFILGVGAKIFIVAGPVIVYGTLASIVVGIIYYFMR